MVYYKSGIIDYTTVRTFPQGLRFVVGSPTQSLAEFRDAPGAIIGYLTGIVVSTGPLSVPLFLFYGLTKGAFLATEAASSLGLYVSKSITFQRFGALTWDVALKGLIAGSSLMFGAFIAKRFVLRLDANVFRLVMDAIMLAAGLSMLWNAAYST